jgi:hypothetical protein
MRIRFQTSGGVGFFPGLAAPRTIDVDALDPKTRETLTTLVRDADFFNLRPQAAARPGAADHCTYQITVEDGSRRHTVSVCDPVTSAPLQQLIEVLRTL